MSREALRWSCAGSAPGQPSIRSSWFLLKISFYRISILLPAKRTLFSRRIALLFRRLRQLRRIPVVRAAQEHFRLILRSLILREEVRVRIALIVARARASRVELGIEGSVERVRVAWMPLAPARGINLVIHLSVHINDRRVLPPRPPQKDGASHPQIGGELRVVDHKSRILRRIVLRLRRDVPPTVGGRMNLAILKHRLAVAEDEIDVPRNVAIGKVLARWRAVNAAGAAA